jgi:glycogen operon protein
MIAEAWDAAGLYQVAASSGQLEGVERPLRDDVRDFFRGEDGSVARIADRPCGSPSIYRPRRPRGRQSVNL